jgi:hypothetical protein
MSSPFVFAPLLSHPIVQTGGWSFLKTVLSLVYPSLLHMEVGRTCFVETVYMWCKFSFKPLDHFVIKLSLLSQTFSVSLIMLTHMNKLIMTYSLRSKNSVVFLWIWTSVAKNDIRFVLKTRCEKVGLIVCSIVNCLFRDAVINNNAAFISLQNRFFWRPSAVDGCWKARHIPNSVGDWFQSAPRNNHLWV